MRRLMMLARLVVKLKEVMADGPVAATETSHSYGVVGQKWSGRQRKPSARQLDSMQGCR